MNWKPVSSVKVEYDETRTVESIFPEWIQTDRLRLTLVTEDDVTMGELYDLLSTDAVAELAEHMPIDAHRSLKETRDLLADAEESHRKGDGAWYVVRSREEDNELAGFAWLDVEWERQRAEPGILLRPKFWGREYSGERALALIAVAFDHLDLESVVVRAEPDNDKSLRAVEKYIEQLDGQRCGTLPNDFGGTPLTLDRPEPRDAVYFAVTREQYEENRETVYDTGD